MIHYRKILFVTFLILNILWFITIKFFYTALQGIFNYDKKVNSYILFFDSTKNLYRDQELWYCCSLISI